MAAAERSQFEDTRLTLGIHPGQFCWVLEPGEHFTTPEAALCCSRQGLTPLTHRLHRAIRERLIREEIPVEPHDYPVPWVLTERGLYEDGVPARLG